MIEEAKDMDEIPECVILDAQHKIYEAKKTHDNAVEAMKKAEEAFNEACQNEHFARRQLQDYARFLTTHNADAAAWFAEVELPHPDECDHKASDAEDGRCDLCGEPVR